MNSRIPVVLALLLLAGVGGCTCAPATPTPVRIVVRNRGDVPLHVDVTDGRLGVELQRSTFNGWTSFVESPACECQACEFVCGGCDCTDSARTPLILKVAEGAELERTWSGVVQVEGAASCGLLQGPSCLYGENAPPGERFRARFCYAENVPALRTVDAGVPVLGVLPQEGVTCVEKEFRPEDGELVFEPLAGAPCQAHAECKGEGELCLGGRCSVGCPANDFPVLGATWRLAVDEPEDQGFFSVAQDAEGITWEGVGTVGAVRYDSGILQLSLLRPGPAGGTLPGRVRVGLPVGYAVPFTLGETVAVWVRDLTPTAGGSQRGIVIRDAEGRLLLAADAAEGKPVLTADRTAPFAVQVDGDVVGCTPTDCGRELQQETRFAAVDGGTVAPGVGPRVEVDGRGYRLLNVANARYERATCRLQRFAPYAVLATRDEQAP
ncbi:MAG: hypothetical protein RL653_2629 [Pseudomonadota bacterium]|jgi:hypothetical protein